MGEKNCYERKNTDISCVLWSHTVFLSWNMVAIVGNAVIQKEYMLFGWDFDWNRIDFFMYNRCTEKSEVNKNKNKNNRI